MAKNLEFYENTDNYEDIVLVEDGAVIDSSTITSIKVDVNGVIIDSVDTPTAFVFPYATTYKGTTVNGIRVNLSLAYSITSLNKKLKTRIIVTSPQFPNGIVWDNNVITTMRRAIQ